MPRLGTSINIPFNGIERVRPTNSDGSGSCSDIVNLRQRGGAWEPVMEKKVQQIIVGVDAVYFHSKLGENERVVLKDYSGTKKLVFYDGAAFDLEALDFALNAGEIIIDYVELGNYLTFTTNQRHINLLWDGSKYEENEYADLSELNVDFVKNGETDILSNATSSTIRGMYQKQQSDKILVEDEYGFTGTFMVRFSVKLKDGRYVYSSSPKIMFQSNSNYRVIGGFRVFGSGYGGYFSVQPDHGILGFELTQNDIDLLSHPEIESLAVCVTKPLNNTDGFNINDIEEPDFDYATLSTEEQITKLQSEGFILLGNDDFSSQWLYPYNDTNNPSNIVDDGNFYILKESPISDLIVGMNEVEEDFDYSNLDLLPIDTTRYSEKLIGGQLDVYNKRSHLFNYQREMVSLETFVDDHFEFRTASSTFVVSDYYVEITVFENGVNNKITKKIGTPANPTKYLAFKSNYIGYGNINATSLRVWAIPTGTLPSPTDNRAELIVEFKKHPTLNLVYIENYDATTHLYNELDYKLEIRSTDINPSVDVAIYDGVVNNDSNIIVSDRNYPLIYDSTNSYSFGDGDMIALAAPTFPLSEGQFGEFPLYVFTTKGVWALSAGSGEVLYASSTPVSREVLLGRNAVSGTEIGIIFLSRGGLNVLAGSNVKPLSLSLSGDPESLIDNIDYKLYLGLNQGSSIDSSGLYRSYPSLFEYIDDVDFLDYISSDNVITGYAYGKDFKDILITNNDYGYSYVFDTMSGKYHKITEVFGSYDNQYPDLYGVTISENIATINNASEESGEYRDVMVETRAQLFDTNRFKKIYRSILRSYIKPHEFNTAVNPSFPNVRCLSSVFALMISLDSKNWEIFDTENRAFEYSEDDLNKAYVDFKITGGATKDLYFKYLFVGSLDKESSISGLAIEAEEEPTKMME